MWQVARESGKGKQEGPRQDRVPEHCSWVGTWGEHQVSCKRDGGPTLQGTGMLAWDESNGRAP